MPDYQPPMHPDDRKMFGRMSMCLVVIAMILGLVATKLVGLHELVGGLLGLGGAP
jgi:hypothetical protein